MARDKTDRTDLTPDATPAKDKPAFPAASDDGMAPFSNIANRWETDEGLVFDAFRGLALPEWSTSEHLDILKLHAGTLNRAARCAEKLIELLGSDLPEEERAMLRSAGCISVEQLIHLRNTLEADASSYSDVLSAPSMSRRGGRSPAIYEIAEGMRRLFRRLRKPISFGRNDYGLPTGDFCKGVEHAIGVFGIRKDWSGPAREAYEKQLRIKHRLDNCLMNRHSR
jgi:hypothetical protein